MAHKDTTSIDHESISNKSKKQPPKPLELPISLPRSNRIRSEATDNNFPLSPAELYIKRQSEAFDLNNPSSGNNSIASSTSTTNHHQIMHDWHEKKINETYKDKPHRYKYGTPPSSSNNSLYRRADSQPDGYHRQTSNSSVFTNNKRKK